MGRRWRRARRQTAQGGEQPAGGLSRRQVLAGAVAGAAVVVIAPNPNRSLAADVADVRSGRGWTKGVIRQAGTVAGVTVLVDEQAFQATPVDFPPDWKFYVGDWVGVDLERKEVYPFISTTEAVGDRIEHVMPNDDPRQSRRVRRSPTSSAS